MAKHQRKIEAALQARRNLIPSSGYYQIGVKTGFFRKPGSQNRKKGY